MFRFDCGISNESGDWYSAGEEDQLYEECVKEIKLKYRRIFDEMRIMRQCKNGSSHMIIIIKNVSYSKSQKKTP